MMKHVSVNVMIRFCKQCKKYHAFVPIIRPDKKLFFISNSCDRIQQEGERE